MIKYNEIPVPEPDGVITQFTCPDSYVPLSLQVYRNGLLATLDVDYTESTPSSGVFTFVTAPLLGDIIRVTYRTVAASITPDRINDLIANARIILPSRYLTHVTDDMLYVWFYIVMQDINQIPMKTSYTLENVPIIYDGALLVGCQLYVAMFVAARRSMEEFSYSNAGRALTIDNYTKVSGMATQYEKLYTQMALNTKKALMPSPKGISTPKFNSLLLRPFSTLYPSRFSST